MGAHVELDITNGLPSALHDALEEIMADDHVQWTMRMIPEPNRVQEFRVRVETPAIMNPYVAGHIWDSLTVSGHHLMGAVQVTVLEVEAS